jgi:hypothetical protein
MSAFRAVGFPVRSRDDLSALARLPRRRGQGQLRLHGGASVQVYRWEVGAGIELWSVQRERTLAAAWPTFMAREARPAEVVGLSFPHTPFNPRLVAEVGVGTEPLAVQLVNYLFVPPEALAEGSQVSVAVTALAPDGWRAAEPPAGEPRLTRVDAQHENAYHLTGRILSAERLTNGFTGEPVQWCRVDAGPVGGLEVVAHGDDAAVSEPGALIVAAVVLRGAVVEILGAAEPRRNGRSDA